MRTKIVATIGPASGSKEVLESMILSGLDVCRLNFSHSNYTDSKKIIKHVLNLNSKHGSSVAILADLQGPKIRVGDIENNCAILVDGKEFILTTDLINGNSDRAFINYQAFPKEVKKGELVLLDDGKIQLKVLSTDNRRNVKTQIIHGGRLSSRKGVNLPDTKISMPALTSKDRKDIDFILQNDIQWVALSFVRRTEDILKLKNILNNTPKGRKIKVIAKIEKPEALENLDDIINVSDGIMVARGDLGVELPQERIPLIQKKIIRKCINASKPVIIATQMMESMITNSVPTRAEVNDVANAVLDGADAVMLSAETSVGKFPVDTVATMQRIISNIEENQEEIYYKHIEPPKSQSDRYISDSVIYNACTMAQQTGAKAITALTYTGYSAFRLAGQRPKASIYIFTNNKSLLRTFNLIWGVRGLYYDKFYNTDHTVEDIRNILKKRGNLTKGDLIINITSTPIQELGKTNTMKLSRI